MRRSGERRPKFIILNVNATKLFIHIRMKTVPMMAVFQMEKCVAAATVFPVIRIVFVTEPNILIQVPDVIMRKTAILALMTVRDIVFRVVFIISMPAVAAKYGVPYIAMHMKGDPKTMQSLTDYKRDITAEVVAYFEARVAALLEDASAYLRGAYRRRMGVQYLAGSNPTFDENVKSVCVAMVARAVNAPGAMAGITQQTQTTGPYSASVTFANPTGDLNLWRSDLKRLGRVPRAQHPGRDRR